jgi:hypothetical protein
MSLLVYGIAARGTDMSPLRGVNGEPLQMTRIGALDVLVGEVRTPPRPSARTLRRYDRILRSLWERRSAVLPARFGTVMRDRAELESTVRARRQTLGRQLAIVRDRVQMTVRLVAALDRESGIGDRRSGGSGGAGAGRSRGRRYLEARARASRLDHVPEVVAVREAVQRWVRAERIEARAGVATVYHLVPRSAVARYLNAAGRAAAFAHFTVHISGPWPPYAFSESW